MSLENTSVLPLTFSGLETGAISKRQCENVPGDATGKKFSCDYEMPTLTQLKERMKKAKATSDASALFYTNLQDPAMARNDNAAAWLITWWKANKKDDPFYWVANAVDYYCE